MSPKTRRCFGTLLKRLNSAKRLKDGSLSSAAHRDMDGATFWAHELVSDITESTAHYPDIRAHALEELSKLADHCRGIAEFRFIQTGA